MRGAVLLLPLLATAACQRSLSESDAQVFESLVRAERDFASTSVAAGMRTAFLESLAADAVIFNAGPVNGRAVWEERQETSAVLAWGPEIADVAAAGDMGYTSGPWELRTRPDTAPVSWGHFVSVWRKDAEGTWKVVADGGITHGPVALIEGGVVARVGGGAEMSPPSGEVDVVAERVALAANDSEYSRSVAENGFAGAIVGFVDRSARFYRNGLFPILGRDAILASPPVTGASWKEWEPADAIVSLSGDLGLTYGTVEFATDNGLSGSPRFASYYRIWKQQQQAGWRLVVDVLIPFTPASE